jgi:ribosomal protein L29
MKSKEFTKDLKEKKLEQLYKDLSVSERTLREIRFKVANRELKDTNQKVKTKRKIAAILTIIREKEYEKITEQK